MWQKNLIHYKPTFFCSSLVKSLLAWLCPEELKWERKERDKKKTGLGGNGGGGVTLNYQMMQGAETIWTEFTWQRHVQPPSWLRYMWRGSRWRRWRRWRGRGGKGATWLARCLVPDLSELGLHGVEGVGADNHRHLSTLAIHWGYLLLKAEEKRSWQILSPALWILTTHCN